MHATGLLNKLAGWAGPASSLAITQQTERAQNAKGTCHAGALSRPDGEECVKAG